MTRFVFILMMVQAASASLILANESSAQGKSIYDIELNLRFSDSPILEVLDKIERKTDFYFSYNSKVLTVSQLVTVNGKYSLGVILEKISRQTRLKFRRVDSNIHIYSREGNEKLVDELKSEDRQRFNVSGKVTGELNEPLPGATVLEKGTTNGSVTDVEGNYSLNVSSENAILTFSFVGYVAMEVPVNSRSVIDVKMNVDISSLQEIVVVGYGEQKKANLTGAVSTISSDLLDERPVSNTADLLAGLAPGLSTTQVSGGIAGGDDPIIRLRGVGTLNNADPLILVDGTPASISDITPSDIENISILKDASAAAIYGSRAANGVILITTKTASVGLKIDYQAFAGFQEVATRPDLITDPIVWMELKNEGMVNSNQPVIFSESAIDEYRAGLGTDALRYPETDWFDILVGDRAFMTSHTLTLSGGSEKSRIRTSFNYLNQDGIGLNNSMERFSLRINNENELTKNLKVGTNLFVAWSDIVPIVDGPPGFNNQQRSFLHMGMQEMPIVPAIQAPDGRWGDAQVDGAGSINNWVALASVIDDEQRRQRAQGQIYASWDILEGLRLDGRVALNYNNSSRNQFIGLIPTGTLWNFNTETGSPTDRGESAFSRKNTTNLLTNFITLTYSKSINDVHNFSVLAGYQLDKFRGEQTQGSIQEFASNSTRVLSAGLENPGVSQNIEKWSLLSYFGRFNYNFKERYLFEANLRLDGSSRFREGKRWGTFPSFSAGWRISEEGFLRDKTFLDELKLRASWGQLGNQQINAYPYQATYSVNETYSFGGNVALGIAQTDIANPDIEWETTTSWNLGLDASFFEGKVSMSVDYFNRETDGILVRQEIPDYLGDKRAPFENLAVVVNKGLEVELMHRNNIGGFTYHAGINFTVQDNELTKYLSDIPFINSAPTGSYVLQEGQPIWSIFGYQNIGVYQTQDEVTNDPVYPVTPSPGDLIFADINGRDANGNLTGIADSLITDADRTVIGNQIPKYLFGANFGFGYGNFDLSIILQGVFDVDTWTGVSAAFWPNDKDDRGQIHEVWLDRWTPENPSSELPRIVSGGAYPQNILPSSFFVEDNSYLRVKNVTLGYNFPEKLLNGLKMSRLRLYTSVDNLFTFSKFVRKWGWDPERQPQQFDVRIPNVRTFVLGANVTF
ncbi:TonB-dependent receptor [Fulvivirgaceae bacterium BMA12]|uniref:TonB-dependent receptor n=1 Tax=Agaribacillus aureus TaxID=3051825 RepID=A0ABT8LI19_9BACT|nr:TonB-dependent receptor [Fulvivirgaceae bacterium BMA12]